MSPLANVAEQWQPMLCKYAQGILFMVVLGRMHLDVPSCRSVVAKEMLRRRPILPQMSPRLPPFGWIMSGVEFNIYKLPDI